MGLLDFWRAEEKVEETYGNKIRRFVNSREFEQKFQSARPYLIASLVAWPVFWMYKGLEWSTMKRRGEILPIYIRKTFFQAKLMQLFIISSGIIVATYKDNENIQRMLEFKDFKNA